MVFNTGTALLDAVVLSVVAQETEGTYGYKITQDVRKIMEVSESTLYPVLRRLQKDDFLETYDMEYAGRNRRYYKLTSNGMIKLDEYRKSWIDYKHTIVFIYNIKRNILGHNGTIVLGTIHCYGNFIKGLIQSRPRLHADCIHFQVNF